MKTGEGKTLVATLPAYLNGLSGKGVHIVTVNDYLAKRDKGMDGQAVQLPGGFLVGLIISGMDNAAKKRPMPVISSTAPTTSSGLTTCGTTWSPTRRTRSSGAMPTPLWTRWTPSPSTRPEPLDHLRPGG